VPTAISIAGLVILCEGIICLFTGIYLLSLTPKPQMELWEKFQAQGELVVFQKKDESQDNAIRRLKCAPGTVVRYDAGGNAISFIVAACDK